eukprot:Nk52_evm121s221 gene=Nk52_evmTU121s221
MQSSNTFRKPFGNINPSSQSAADKPKKLETSSAEEFKTPSRRNTVSMAALLAHEEHLKSTASNCGNTPRPNQKAMGLFNASVNENFKPSGSRSDTEALLKSIEERQNAIKPGTSPCTSTRSTKFKVPNDIAEKDTALMKLRKDYESLSRFQEASSKENKSLSAKLLSVEGRLMSMSSELQNSLNREKDSQTKINELNGKAKVDASNIEIMKKKIVSLEAGLLEKANALSTMATQLRESREECKTLQAKLNCVEKAKEELEKEFKTSKLSSETNAFKLEKSIEGLKDKEKELHANERSLNKQLEDSSNVILEHVKMLKSVEKARYRRSMDYHEIEKVRKNCELKLKESEDCVKKMGIMNSSDVQELQNQLNEKKRLCEKFENMLHLEQVKLAQSKEKASDQEEVDGKTKEQIEEQSKIIAELEQELSNEINLRERLENVLISEHALRMNTAE